MKKIHCTQCGEYLYEYATDVDEIGKSGLCDNCWAAHGPEFWTLEYAPSYGIEICRATRITDLAEYAEWYRPHAIRGVRGTRITLDHISWRDLPDRQSEGMFPGCDNRAWVISDDEKAHYINLNQQRADAIAAKKRAEADVDAQKIDGLIAAAKATRKKQKISSWVSNQCLDNLDDCSFDHVTRWIDADGKITQTHQHCH